MGRCYTKADEIDIIYSTAWCSCGDYNLSDIGYGAKRLLVFDKAAKQGFKILNSFTGGTVLRAGYRGIILNNTFYVLNADYSSVVDYLSGESLDYGGSFGSLPCGGNSTTGDFWIYDFNTNKFKKGTFGSTGFRIIEAFNVGTNIYFIMLHIDGQIRRSLCSYTNKNVLIEPNETLFGDVFGCDNESSNIFLPYWKFDGTSCSIARFLTVDSSGNVLNNKEYSSLVGGFYPEFICISRDNTAWMFSNGYSECSSGNKDTFWKYDYSTMDFVSNCYYEFSSPSVTIEMFFPADTKDYVVFKDGSGVYYIAEINYGTSSITSNGFVIHKRSTPTASSGGTVSVRSFTSVGSIADETGTGSTTAPFYINSCPS